MAGEANQELVIFVELVRWKDGKGGRVRVVRAPEDDPLVTENSRAVDSTTTLPSASMAAKAQDALVAEIWRNAWRAASRRLLPDA